MNIYREISWKLHIAEVMKNAYFRNMQDAGMLSEGRLPVMRYAVSNPGCTQQEIADTLGISAPAVTGALKRLEKDGLVTRAADENNLRRNNIYATREGERITRACVEEIERLDRLFYGGFTQEELANFNGYLERVIEGYSGEKYDCGRMRQLLEKVEGQKVRRR